MVEKKDPITTLFFVIFKKPNQVNLKYLKSRFISKNQDFFFEIYSNWSNSMFI